MESLWEELGAMHNHIKGTWLVCGDFNCVLNCDERVGSQVRSWEIESLRRWLNICDFHDIKNISNRFT